MSGLPDKVKGSYTISYRGKKPITIWGEYEVAFAVDGAKQIGKLRRLASKPSGQ